MIITDILINTTMGIDMTITVIIDMMAVMMIVATIDMTSDATMGILMSMLNQCTFRQPCMLRHNSHLVLTYFSRYTFGINFSKYFSAIFIVQDNFLDDFIDLTNQLSH
jgi:hypothetical protein